MRSMQRELNDALIMAISKLLYNCISIVLNGSYREMYSYFCTLLQTQTLFVLGSKHFLEIQPTYSMPTFRTLHRGRNIWEVWRVVREENFPMKVSFPSLTTVPTSTTRNISAPMKNLMVVKKIFTSLYPQFCSDTYLYPNTVFMVNYVLLNNLRLKSDRV